MTRINYHFFCLLFGIFFISNNIFAQSVNFEETWKEFLENNQISNMSALNKPHKYDDPLNYIKYLMMNMNTSFCQSEIAKAEKLVAQIYQIEPKARQAIPGYVEKLDDLEAKIKAYHSMDDIWQRFILSKDVDLEELESITAAKTSCEKQTLAKYSYMTAYYNYCKGNVARAKDIIENRTLRLAEKTSLRVEDVNGLGPELAKMKKLFQNITKLETNWKDYMETGVSPGFDTELPLFPCNPIPNMKEWVLKGAIDVCNSGSIMLEKIQELQTKSGVAIDGALAEKVKELENAVEGNETQVAILNEAWAAFIPNNVVERANRNYGYEYCTTEPLIRAYIMDGFANVCGNAEDRLQQIEEIRKSDKTALSKITVTKIDELTAEFMENQTAELDINDIWKDFVAHGDDFSSDYPLADYYCDHVYDVKSWLIKGLGGNCQEGREYLEQIDEVQETLEFEFAVDVRCRITKLRIKVWDCQHEALSKLASVESDPESVAAKLEALIEEYGIGERPEVCIE